MPPQGIAKGLVRICEISEISLWYQQRVLGLFFIEGDLLSTILDPRAVFLMFFFLFLSRQCLVLNVGSEEKENYCKRKMVCSNP